MVLRSPAITLPPLKEQLKEQGLFANKALGQNFLLDEGITDRIAQAAGALEGRQVVEIGPGPGGLTRALLARGAAQVTAIEKDSRFTPLLALLGEAYPGAFTLHPGDALKVEVTSLVPAPRKIVANLPYNVATPLLVGWLHRIAAERSAFESLTLMFQKEVADRIIAAPDSSDYGRLSVLCQWLCETSVALHLPPSAFLPPPKVWSSVVVLIPRPEPLAPASLVWLERVVAAAFGQRRKMLRGALKGLPVAADLLLEQAGIDGTRRGETLSVEEFCLLARTAEALHHPSR
jgi:16S rRNA (adenine1518-N6/adenine1519-N6)-dimethyltransferase